MIANVGSLAVGDVVAKAIGEARYVGVVVAIYPTARGALSSTWRRRAFR